jgi:peptidoglycan-associated lipoprotein
MFSTRNLTIIGLAMWLSMFAAGCKKKVPPPPPPPPPPAEVKAPPAKPVAPTVGQFTAEPTTIQRGQSATLRWEISGDATSVSIDNAIGAVQNTGNRRVFPSDSTTYTLTATGPGGSITASATVTVTTPPPPPPPPVERPQVSIEQRITTDVQDVYFDYDKSDVRGDARDVLNRNVTALKSILADFPSSSIVLEGHCDERGSAEYNLGLGDRRSSSVKEFLVQLGIPDNRLKTISYGKERPVCNESDESCWQKNRRVHFAPGQ